MEDRVLLTNTLEGLQIDPTVIAGVMTMLDARADTLHGASTSIAQVPAGWFGDSHTGGYRLATNAAMARDAAVDEFENLVQGLRGYAAEIKAFRDDVVSTDESITAHLTAVQKTAECTTAPTIGSGQCAAPATTGDNDR